MTHLSDEELKELKSRVATAMGTGANIARSNEIMFQLIAEVEEHRNPKPRKIGVLKVGEMDVKKAEPEPAPPPPPPPSERNIPTTQMLPEETQALIDKTKPKAHEKGKKK
jgi:hypothetical protein